MNTSLSTGSLESSSIGEMPTEPPGSELFQGTMTSDLALPDCPGWTCPDCRCRPSVPLPSASVPVTSVLAPSVLAPSVPVLSWSGPHRLWAPACSRERRRPGRHPSPAAVARTSRSGSSVLLFGLRGRVAAAQVGDPADDFGVVGNDPAVRLVVLQCTRAVPEVQVA